MSLWGKQQQRTLVRQVATRCRRTRGGPILELVVAKPLHSLVVGIAHLLLQATLVVVVNQVDTQHLAIGLDLGLGMPHKGSLGLV